MGESGYTGAVMETAPPSPYGTPPSQMAGGPVAPPPLDPGPPPSAIKVFGILHLVIAGIGILSGVWTVFMVLFFKDFIAWMGRVSGGRQPVDYQEAQLAYMAELQWLTWLQLAASVVLIVFLLLAGVRLLKRRNSGRIWSIRYGWTSIVSKIVTLVLMIVYGLPAASRMNQTILGDAGSGMASLMTVVSTVAGIASTMIYPILVISILNGQRVRNYLAGR